MSFPLGISDSQKKAPPLPPAVVSQSDSGSNRNFDDGASYLTFQDTTYTGKLPIIDYTITAVSTDGLDTVNQTVNALTPFVLTGLKSGKSYKFKVRARNLVFNSDYSSEFGPGTATTVPGRVTSPGATNLANGGGATLSWSAPANGGKPITSYLITPNIGATIETGNASTSYSFSGLTVGTGYNFTIQARNENGLGTSSTTSNLITITAPVVTVGTTTVGTTTVGTTTVGTTTVGTTPTCGACQDVTGTVIQPTCNGEDSYQGYYQKRAQVCSDGSQVACSPGGFLYFGNLIKTCESSCGCTVTVSPCSALSGTACGYYSAGCGYVGTYDCAGSCVNVTCSGCCACDPTFCTTTVSTTTVGTTTVGTTTVGTTTVGTTTVGGCAQNEGFPCRCSGGCYGIRTCSGGCDCSGCTTTTVGTTTVGTTTAGTTTVGTTTVGTTTVGTTTPISPTPTVGGGGGCLVSGTLVSTPNGMIPAELIKVGDVVHSLKFAELGKDETVDTIPLWASTTFTPIELNTTTIKAIVVEKSVDYYLSINGDLMTPEHPVLVKVDGVYRFMMAGDIQIGYQVLKRHGDKVEGLVWTTVTTNDMIFRPETVYLFDAEDEDVIFTANMLTHNFKAAAG